MFPLFSYLNTMCLNLSPQPDAWFLLPSFLTYILTIFSRIFFLFSEMLAHPKKK